MMSHQLQIIDILVKHHEMAIAIKVSILVEYDAEIQNQAGHIIYYQYFDDTKPASPEDQHQAVAFINMNGELIWTNDIPSLTFMKNPEINQDEGKGDTLGTALQRIRANRRKTIPEIKE